MKIGIVGLGFVGSAIKYSLELKDIDLVLFDKFKNGGIGKIEDILSTDINFLALPTIFKEELKQYDKTAVNDICQFLNDMKYSGTVVLKSTVEPGTTASLEKKYSNLNFVHNPEFLTARTANEDFHNQQHIVLGKGPKCSNDSFDSVSKFFENNYPSADLTKCNSTESESMKIFVNNFYSVKVQFFTELYLLCQKMNNCDFNNVKNMMLKNGWINPMHTDVPGPDGKISYGGLCFPKDTQALLGFMKSSDSSHSVIEATVKERDEMRDDFDNVDRVNKN
jgi:UDPglucose 6-dehydrogenase